MIVSLHIIFKKMVKHVEAFYLGLYPLISFKIASLWNTVNYCYCRHPSNITLVSIIRCHKTEQLKLKTNYLVIHVRYSVTQNLLASSLLSYILQFNLILGLNVTVGGKPLGYFTSVAEDLNSRLLRTNTASGQGGVLNSGPPDYSPVP